MPCDRIGVVTSTPYLDVEYAEPSRRQPLEDDDAKDRDMHDDAARIAELEDRVESLEAERADLLDRLAVINRASDTSAP